MSFPSILCYVSEENGTPQNFMKVLQRHFKVVTTEEFDKNPAEFSQQIVAIFNFHGKPTVSAVRKISSVLLRSSTLIREIN